MEPLVNVAGLMSADGGSKLKPTPVVSKFSFDAIKVAHLTQQPMCDERVLVTRLIKLPSGVRPARCQLDVLFVAGKAGLRN
jgi:hypothetical protein